jgi:hypothetical protein
MNNFTDELSFDEKVCLLIQGPLKYSNEIIKSYEPFKSNVIISTNDYSLHNLEKLSSEKFMIVTTNLAEYPGRANINNQVKTTFEGVKKAQEIGFDYIFKIRSDVFIDDIYCLIELLDKKFIYFPAYHNYDGGYLCDFMMFAPTKFMLNFWNIPLTDEDVPPETILTRKYLEINKADNLEYIFPLLYTYKINAYWAKYDKFFNNYQNDPKFTYQKQL